MAKNIGKIQRIAVTANPQLPDSSDVAVEIDHFLRKNGYITLRGLLQDEDLRESIRAREFDLLIALGGDGTILRAGHLCGPVNVPILGINMGRFGFLTEIKQNDWRETLPLLFTNEYWLEKRMMLCADLKRSSEIIGTWEVLNEIVVSRGHIVRPVHLLASVDGHYLTTYVADGLIAATATGSTAYALAAGGPILPPTLRNILLVAVAPHLSVDRTIVLSEGSSVSITIQTDHHAVLSPDGQIPVELQDGDQVDAYASEHTAQFLRFQDPGYFYRNLTLHMSQHPSIGILR